MNNIMIDIFLPMNLWRFQDLQMLDMTLMSRRRMN